MTTIHYSNSENNALGGDALMEGDKVIEINNCLKNQSRPNSIGVIWEGTRTSGEQ